MKKIYIYLIIVAINGFILCSCNNRVLNFDNSTLNSYNNNKYIYINEEMIYGDFIDGNYSIIKENKNKKVLSNLDGSDIHSINVYDDNLIFVERMGEFDRICKFNQTLCKLDVLSEDILLGNMIIEDNYIYYVNDKSNLIQVNINNFEKKILAFDVGYEFDVGNKCVYYNSVDIDMNMSIKKISVDNQKMCDILYHGGTTGIYSYNDDLYFIKTNCLIPYKGSVGQLCKIDKNGNFSIILEQEIATYNIHNDAIYYVDVKNNRNLFKVNIDGSSKQKILDEEVFSVCIFDNVAICTVRNDVTVQEEMFSICKINLEPIG